MTDNDLSMAMLELKMAVDKFAAAFTAAVVRDLKSQVEILAAAYPPGARAEFFDYRTLKLDKVPGACPKTAVHPRHTWRFPDGAQARECPGVQFPEEACLRTDVHLDHSWEHLAPTEGDPVPTVSLGRWCPGVKPADVVPSENAERQCPDNLAHHTHRWTSYPWAFNCPGLELDLEARYCDSRPYDHAAHEHLGAEGLTVFCKGFREVPVKRCRTGKAHEPHNWQDDTDKVAACPGRGIFGVNTVPAGPDRHA